MPKPSKEDDLSWVFDSLVDFLRGPMWNLPIINFIEQKSMIFEPDGDNQKAYKKVHEDYKSLVDFMLGTYMEDICITPQQFEAACNKAAPHMKTKFHQMLFEQLWAADDFNMFERMMVRTNIELQLQALQLLQQRHGIIPASFVPGDEDAGSEEERKVLERVLQRSLQEQGGGRQRSQEQEQEQRWQRQLMAEREREQQLIAARLKLQMTEAVPAAGDAARVSPEEIKKRQAYLRQQRDKLLAMKRSEREKILETTQQENAAARPKSSRAARSAFTGKVDHKTMEMRKHLAQALRREVVNKK